MKKKPQSVQKYSKIIKQITILLQTPNKKQVAFRVQSPCHAKTVNQIINNRIGPEISLDLHYFQSKNEDWLTDYKIQMNSGWIQNDICLQAKTKQSEESEETMKRYDILKCIGIGGFSKVYLSRDKTSGLFYAAKFIQKAKLKDKLELIMNQITINTHISFPFLVHMKSFIQTQAYYIMILEYCPGGQLFNLQRKVMRFTEEQAKKYFLQVLFAIEYLHSKNIMYRDLKPENIMLDINGHIKITDFGLAKISNQKRFSYCGSLEYMSPEIILKEGHSFEVDYYCMGVLLYQMVVGCPPFYEHRSRQQDTKCRILYSDVMFPQDVQLSEQIKNLLSQLLQKNPNKRLGHFAGIRQIKCHPWIGWINKQKIVQKQLKMPYPVDLNHFNFDAKDITESADRMLDEINKKKYSITRLKKQSRSKNSKSREHSKQNKLSLKKLSHTMNNYKSLTNISNIYLKKIEPLEKQQVRQNLYKKLSKKKYSASNESLKITKYENLRKVYHNPSNMTHHLNLSKFMRHPTEVCEKKSKSKQKDRRTYMRFETESKENIRFKQVLKKTKGREQYIFNKVNR